MDENYVDTREPILRTKGIDWPANDLCVCFVNTAEGREDPSRVYSRASLGLVAKPLEGYDNVVRWMGRVGGLSDDEVAQLLAMSDAFPPPAIEVNAKLMDLRRLFTRIVDRLLEQEMPFDEDHRAFAALVQEVWTPLVYVPATVPFWKPVARELDLDLPYRQLVLSMARLLSTRSRRHVCRCKGKGCTLLFVNSSGSRRYWCHKKVCGEKNRKRQPRRGH